MKTTIRSLEKKNLPSRFIPYPHGGQYGIPEYYEYPHDWPDVRWAADGTIELVVGDSTNAIISFVCSTSSGQFRVDWGDGNSNDYNSFDQAQHQYTSGTGIPCDRGYTTWKITISALTGSLTRFYIINDTIYDSTSYYAILAACFNTPALTSLSNAFYQTNVRCGMLEYVKLERSMTSLTNVNYAFDACYNLLYADISGFIAVTTSSDLFNSCYGLPEVNVDSLAYTQSASALFRACYAMKFIDVSALTAVVTMANMCYQCYNLSKIVYPASMPNLTSMHFLHYANLSLLEVDISGAINITTLSNAFYNNYHLKTANLSGLTDVEILEYTFQGCCSLTTLTATNLGADATSVLATDAFYLCEVLETVALSGCKFSKLGVRGNSAILNNTTVITFHASSTFSDVNSPQFDMRYCDMTGSQIDTIFTALPSVSGKTIDITGCTGAGDCTPSIATGKGWTVTGGP